MKCVKTCQSDLNTLTILFLHLPQTQQMGKVPLWLTPLLVPEAKDFLPLKSKVKPSNVTKLNLETHLFRDKTITRDSAFKLYTTGHYCNMTI